MDLSSTFNVGKHKIPSQYITGGILMIDLGPRFILDDFRGWNFWSPHYPLLYVNNLRYRQDAVSSIWKPGYAYTLGVF